MKAACIAVIIILLYVNVILHEAGHFAATRLFGVAVTEFGVGFGKRLAWMERNGTKYSLCILPFGGFVESPDDEVNALPFWKHALILAAGCAVNAALAFIETSAALILIGRRTQIIRGTFSMLGSILSAVGASLSELFGGGIDLSRVKGAGGTLSSLGDLSVSLGGTAQMQIGVALLFCGMLSLILAVGNMFPIPSFDGGQIVFSAMWRTVKKMTGRDITPALARVNTFFILAVMVLSAGYFLLDFI